jgi:hypothetical protein
MPYHFGALIEEHDSAGVIIVAQDMPIGRAITGLLRIWRCSKADDWVNAIRRL